MNVARAREMKQYDRRKKRWAFVWNEAKRASKLHEFVWNTAKLFLSPLLISAPRLLSEKIFLSFWSLVFIVLLLFSCAPNRFTTPRVPHCLRVSLSVKSTTAKLFAPNPETLPNRTTNEAKRNHTPHRKQQGVSSLVRCRRGKKINK